MCIRDRLGREQQILELVSLKHRATFEIKLCYVGITSFAIHSSSDANLTFDRMIFVIIIYGVFKSESIEFVVQGKDKFQRLQIQEERREGLIV